MTSSWSNNTGVCASLHGRLLNRETGDWRRSSKISTLYGDRSWVANLDIVNELAGHQGCVNALSWSKSGRLLASGSDDTNLLIHRYQPENTTKPFSIATCLSTGHRANIFSVKFMPHSNDNTLISCAGDHEVRIFDLEYSGSSQGESAPLPQYSRSQAGQRRIGELYNGVSYLSEVNTNVRIYRSHSDRVKRIVTESSPHLFLTCSEDGEVRQFDLRLPSTAYPKQGASRTATEVPPPLISYKKYHLDLNSISCSASQPHYIVLGGAHLHCFLHDRRMLGRDLTEEKGSISGSDMGTATRCVRRFAPNGKEKMNPRSPGHVTACKISDKNPNEMIASWSGDRIYAFNLLQADENKTEKHIAASKSRESKDRKRKRGMQAGGEEDVVIRMRYGNGQTEDFPVTQSESHRFIEQARESVLSDSQKRSARIAKSVAKIRNLLFSMDHGSDLAQLRPVLSEILGLTASNLPEIDDIMRTWSYPVDPDRAVITFQTTLRKNRDTTRRFVQACGSLVRVLGGKLRVAGSSPLVKLFGKVEASELEYSGRSCEQRFRYDFLKAILLWLEGGASKLASEFSQQVSRRTAAGQDLTEAELEVELVNVCSYLTSQADIIEPTPIVSVDNSRFERDELRMVFVSELAAVRAFAAAIKIPFDQGGPVASHSSQNQEVAMKFWGLKVYRGLLMNAAEGVNFAFVDRAFGGLGLPSPLPERSQKDIDPNAEDPAVTSAELVPVSNNDQDEEHSSEGEDEELPDEPLMSIEDILADVESLEGEEMEFDDEQQDGEEEEEEEAEEGEDDDDNDASDDVVDEDSTMEDDGESGDEGELDTTVFFRGSAARSTLRAQVNQDIHCNSHIRSYQGHCNVKTVKDVNFFGLDDEYVVSGCDSGHFFIWDTKTSKLLNILKGDGEVVNVVQGHPYEPTLAVSGIDHTIKIFSPDGRAQHAVRKGSDLGMRPNQSSGSSSLRWMRAPTTSTERCPAIHDPEGEDLSDNEPENGGLPSRRRMQSSYEIISQNEVDRAGGNREAFITRDMLSQIALVMARRRARGDIPEHLNNPEEEEDDDDDDEEAQVINAALEDRCATM